MQLAKRFFIGAAAIALASVAPAATYAQMVTGADMPGYYTEFGLKENADKRGDVSTQLIGSTIPGNVLIPGEQGKWTFQVTNTGSVSRTIRGTVEVIAYGTRGVPNDIWKPTVYRTVAKPVATVPFTATVNANGFADVVVAPMLPARFGGYAFVVDLGAGLGRRFLTTAVRTFAPDTRPVQYPAFCLDELPLPVMKRLGVRAIRWGCEYIPTTNPRYEEWYADKSRRLKEFHDAGITVLFMAGGGDFMGDTQPLGRPRPWLDESGKMQNTKFDLAWKPKYDPDFEKWCYRFAKEHGYPKGSINAFSLWNEPWEGISISGWGADMIRYRDIFTAMCQGVDKARKNDGVEVLLGGADSTSNAFDKFFADGSETFLPWFDFVSIHYQGLDSGANVTAWRERKNERGRVKIWDTESWVANTDDRVATVIATNHASGYDRAMGIYGGNVVEADDSRYKVASGGDANGTKEVKVVHTWSTAASVGAAQHFLGERDFNRLLFQNGLPWVMVFDGLDKKADDGTVVVVGDIGESFGGNQLPYRTARGFAELKHKAALRKQLAALPKNAPEATRTDLLKQIEAPESLTGGTMMLPADPAYALYDFYGNRVPTVGGKIVVPLDGRGFFLRGAPGAKPGAFAKLIKAVQTARVTGIEPVATVAHDFTAPVGAGTPVRLTLTNVLNRAVTGRLRVAVGGMSVQNPAAPITLQANETRVVSVPVSAAKPSPGNTYPLSLVFDAGADGVAEHSEDIHANVIARRTVQVDGDLSDWENVLPQTILPQTGGSSPSLTEAAWFPFKALPASVGSGFATGYLAADNAAFYFAARVADESPEDGMLRFSKRDDDVYFYPKVSYDVMKTGQTFSVRWTGFVVAPKTGKYRLSTVSDDGVRVWTGNTPLWDDWKDHGAEENAATVTLEAGKPFPIRVEYYQGGGGATLKLRWQPEGGQEQIIPTDALRDKDSKAGGLTGQYFVGTNLDGKPLTTRTDATLNFDWGAKDVPTPEFGTGALEELTWPDDIRRYSYRMDPELPAGNFPNHDNIQIAFNVLPREQKIKGATVPGIPPELLATYDSDYQYALNPVAPKYGGGTEVWRLDAPGLPHKHYYPRQPKAPGEGAVADARLVVKRDGNNRIVECAIPWSELPEVKKRLDAGDTVKFSFRVNDNKGAGGTMELSRGRSVAKRGGSFQVDWVEHWSNDIAFGWEPVKAASPAE